MSLRTNDVARALGAVLGGAILAIGGGANLAIAASTGPPTAGGRGSPAIPAELEEALERLEESVRR